MFRVRVTFIRNRGAWFINKCIIQSPKLSKKKLKTGLFYAFYFTTAFILQCTLIVFPETFVICHSWQWFSLIIDIISFFLRVGNTSSLFRTMNSLANNNEQSGKWSWNERLHSWGIKRLISPSSSPWSPPLHATIVNNVQCCQPHSRREGEGEGTLIPPSPRYGISRSHNRILSAG